MHPLRPEEARGTAETCRQVRQALGAEQEQHDEEQEQEGRLPE